MPCPRAVSLALRIKAAVDAGALRIVAPFAITDVGAVGARTCACAATWQGNDARVNSADESHRLHGRATRNWRCCANCGLDLDPTVEATRSLAPLIDPNLHSCGTVRPHGEAELRQPEKDFYIVGMKSYGRAPTFPGRDRLRTGSLGCRGSLWRLGGGARCAIEPARDGRLRHRFRRRGRLLQLPRKRRSRLCSPSTRYQ